MEIKTPEELRNAFPELVAQVETAARAEGATAERNRIQDIESVQAAIGNAQLVQDAKYGEKPMNAQELAFAAMKAQAAAGASVVNALNTDAMASGAAAVTPAPAADAELSPEEKAKAEIQAAVDLYKSTK